MTLEQIEALIEKYFLGQTSKEEEALIKQWYDQKNNQYYVDHSDASLNLDDPDHLNTPISPDQMDSMKAEMLQSLLTKVRRTPQSPVAPFKKKPFWKRPGLAAAILLLIGSISVIVLYQIRTSTDSKVAVAKAAGNAGANIRPGQTGATLHLSNGKTILLDSLQNGIIASQSGVQIIKNNDKITYIGNAREVIYNDITTSKGQQWNLTLPDGTKVWLNAASSIHYPLNFTGRERLVSITGEAYFEVVHNANQPFKVTVGNTLIEDIGTAFNINAYGDEPAIKTTLLHGSVKVSAGKLFKLLEPGQQAIIHSNQTGIAVKEVNAEKAAAWKNGEMVFDNEDLHEVLRKVARWYDIEVSFAKGVPDRKFAGSISRNMNLSEFLHLLEFENVHFKLNGTQMTLLP